MAHGYSQYNFTHMNKDGKMELAQLPGELQVSHHSIDTMECRDDNHSGDNIDESVATLGALPAIQVGPPIVAAGDSVFASVGSEADDIVTELTLCIFDT